MRAVNFAIAFAFEIKLTGGNNHTHEVILGLVTSDISIGVQKSHLACQRWLLFAWCLSGTMLATLLASDGFCLLTIVDPTLLASDGFCLHRTWV